MCVCIYVCVHRQTDRRHEIMETCVLVSVHRPCPFLSDNGTRSIFPSKEVTEWGGSWSGHPVCVVITHAHAHTHSYSHAHTHACALIHDHTCTRTHIHVHTLTCVHTLTYVHTYHTRSQAHTPQRAQTALLMNGPWPARDLTCPTGSLR